MQTLGPAWICKCPRAVPSNPAEDMPKRPAKRLTQQDKEIKEMTVKELQKNLKDRNLDTTGNKKELVRRLEAAKGTTPLPPPKRGKKQNKTSLATKEPTETGLLPSGGSLPAASPSPAAAAGVGSKNVTDPPPPLPAAVPVQSAQIG